ncbi:MAG: hypothetical protein VW945_05325 [Candidatus Poseidoniales archaeon]|jgi:hypothetical protein
MASKKEGAQRVLDAHASRLKVKQRFVPVAVVIVLIGIGVAALTRWEFGLATVLLCGLLFQYAVERMTTILDAGVINGLKDMGWDVDTELDEATLEKISTIAAK